MMQNNQAIPFNKENFKQIFSLPFISVIIISIPSAIIAEYFNIPLAWFLGPMLITSLASLMGLKTKMPRLVLSSILIILGLYIGNYIDKDLFNQMQDWIWTSFIMLIYIILSVLIVSKYLEKFSRCASPILVIIPICGFINLVKFLISIGGKGIALTKFLLFVSFLSLFKLIVEIRLIIFLFFENFNLGNILLPTLGVTPNNITEDLSIIS